MHPIYFKSRLFSGIKNVCNLFCIPLPIWMYFAPLYQWISALIWNMCRSAGSGDLSSAKCNTRSTFSSVQSGPVRLSLVELSPRVQESSCAAWPAVPLSIWARACGCASSCCLLNSSKQAARQLSRSVATVLAATLNWLKRCRRRPPSQQQRVAAIRRAYKLHPAGRTPTPATDWTLTNACIYFLLCPSHHRRIAVVSWHLLLAVLQ